jgi:hypothetical protein
VADKQHPYTSGQSGLIKTIEQLKKSFPATFNADTLKRLGLAPNNESYILNILRFLSIIDGENKKVPEAGKVFVIHGDEEFKEAFGKLIFNAYHELFELHGSGAWELDANRLIGFFRQSDSTSDLVGRRQASTFQTLAKLAGKLAEDVGGSSAPKSRIATATKRVPKAKAAAPAAQPPSPEGDVAAPPIGVRDAGNPSMALTVRVEINLPAGGDQQTYDAIFKSIRENLLNGNT